ncbi:hypothetical protein ACLOJK_020230 [Asimina triloba]
MSFQSCTHKHHARSLSSSMSSPALMNSPDRKIHCPLLKLLSLLGTSESDENPQKIRLELSELLPLFNVTEFDQEVLEIPEPQLEIFIGGGERDVGSSSGKGKKSLGAGRTSKGSRKTTMRISSVGKELGLVLSTEEVKRRQGVGSHKDKGHWIMDESRLLK